MMVAFCFSRIQTCIIFGMTHIFKISAKFLSATDFFSFFRLLQCSKEVNISRQWSNKSENLTQHCFQSFASKLFFKIKIFYYEIRVVKIRKIDVNVIAYFQKNCIFLIKPKFELPRCRPKLRSKIFSLPLNFIPSYI